MKIKNFSVAKVVYFEDERGNKYRATSEDNIEKLYGESWESEYGLKVEFPEEIKCQMK